MILVIEKRRRVTYKDSSTYYVWCLGLYITPQHVVSVGGDMLDFKHAFHLAEEIAANSNGSIIVQMEVGKLKKTN
jgi:hypothetical protein